MFRSLLFGLLGTAALAAGLILSVPAATVSDADPIAEIVESEHGADGGHGEGEKPDIAASHDLPVLVAPIISDDNAVVGYQSLALSLVTREKFEPPQLKQLQIAIEDAFNEFIATSTQEQRREQFNDLFTLGHTLEKKAKERIGRKIEFDLVALQSDIFSKAETRQNLIEPKTGTVSSAN